MKKYFTAFKNDKERLDSFLSNDPKIYESFGENNISLIEENNNVKIVNLGTLEPIVKQYPEATGSADIEGLEYIEWPINDMRRMIENVSWNEVDNQQHLVPQNDKDLVPMDMNKINGAKNTLTYCPYFDTRNVTDMSYMFRGCLYLTSVPQFDTSKVTDMGSMFNYCSSLTSVPQFDTSNVADMHYMFCNCLNLKTVPQFDTSKVTDMDNMFRECSKLKTVPKFDTSSVTDMHYMFCNCSSLTSVPQFDTSKVTSMNDMFSGCSSLTSVPQFDTSSVTYMYSMFSDCSSLTSVPKFDTSSVIYMHYMFFNCSSLTSVPQFDTSKVINMGGMLSGCSSLTSVEFTGGVPSNCNCNNMFNDVTTTGILKIHTGGSINRASYQPVINVLPSTWTVEEINDLV